MKLPDPDAERPWRTDPDYNKVREVIRGTVMMSPRPAPLHALVASNLSMMLGPPFHKGNGGPGGWWLLFAPELHLGAEELAPDLAGWRRERLPSLPRTAYFALAPDWVCEVLSPSTEEIDRTDKLEIYAEHGVRHLWLAHPVLRTLEVYRLDPSGSYLLVRNHRGRRVINAEPFDALPLDLGQIWAE